MKKNLGPISLIVIGLMMMAVSLIINPARGEQKKPGAKFVSAKTVKGAKAPVKAKKGDAAPGDFALIVGTNDDVLIQGDNGTGTAVDLSAVATVVATSSDTTILTIGAATPVSPVSYNEKAIAAGTATVTVVATWADGSVGPFTITYTVTVSPAPPPAVTGLIISHGTPKVN